MSDGPHDDTDADWLVPRPGIDYAEPDPDSLWAYRHVNGFVPTQKSMTPIKRLLDSFDGRASVPPKTDSK